LLLASLINKAGVARLAEEPKERTLAKLLDVLDSLDDFIGWLGILQDHRR